VELETDKVTLEVNASAAGTLSEIRAEEGSEVEVGAVLGLIAEGAAAAKAPAAKGDGKAAPASAEKAAPERAERPAPAAEKAAPTETVNAGPERMESKSAGAEAPLAPS